jgi:hypothetical protein
MRTQEEEQDLTARRVTHKQTAGREQSLNSLAGTVLDPVVTSGRIRLKVSLKFNQ